MTSTRAASTPPTGTRVAGRTGASASVIALQRSAGNASTLALLRRARRIEDEPPVTLTISGLVDGAAVSSWSLSHDGRSQAVELQITRPVDTNSPVLAKAMIDGVPGSEGRLVVRRLTPLGWVDQLTVTMEDCMVAEYAVHGNEESAWLRFSRIEFER